ncbi:hypothetical protein [Chamaesiphon polymorphus]|uniref:Uncharacterized protein n=1 Tax=Chamaesiphon polymorphus CCALA 037 TaxID=2107692 RepID=A0A2T1GFS7_9CYAN|nr:hypothetical protein [Chamaesiphon polymorphus]PSB56471.1 hypothetical protein C7B77_11800 [Chamaesiphon polymorphus CCALA 037]
MDYKESIGAKLGKLRNKITELPNKFSEAIQEGLQEEYQGLNCVKRESLDFDLIERDIDEIHRSFKKSGDTVLGSQVIIDDEYNFIEIKTYVKRGDKKLSFSAKSTVKIVTNIPSDIVEEMKNTGRVELGLKP